MSGDFLNNLYLTGGLFVAMTTVMGMFVAILWRAIQQMADDLRRDIRRVEKSGRRLEKRLSGEIRKTNQEIRKTNKSVRRLQLDMQVVKDRLNIGAVSRPVVPVPVASESEGASAVSSVPAAVDQAPQLPDAGSVGSVPAADIPGADVGSESVAHRRGRAGAVPPGISATPAAAEQ